MDRDRNVRVVYDEVLRRDDYTCQGCGWRSERYQEIHPVDNDHRHLKKTNLVTLCPFCHQIFHLNAASRSGGGELIWLPEISQATLHLMMFPLFVATRSTKHPAYELALSLERNLKNRTALFRTRFPKGDPGYLAEHLLNLTPDAYAKRGESLRHIRLMPRRERFTAQIEHYAPHEYAAYAAADWAKLLPADLDVQALLQTSAKA